MSAERFLGIVEVMALLACAIVVALMIFYP